MPESIIIPVSSMGNVTDIRKQILQNTLEDELKYHFRLISQEKFEEAQEKAFEQLEYEECTEDQCIMMIQEMLQVENVFHLQVIGEDKDAQLSLSWRTLDEKKKEEEFCENCGTKELRNRIVDLVENYLKKGIDFKNEVKIKKTKGILYFISENGKLKFNGKDKDFIYDGEILNGLPHGKGILLVKGNKFFEGNWMNGKRSGFGIRYLGDNIAYEGQWENDFQHGQGRERVEFSGVGNYREYKGGFYENEYHGKGIIIHNDPSFKRRKIGEWNHGIEWNITEQTIWNDGIKDFRKWVNGIEQ